MSIARLSNIGTPILLIRPPPQRRIARRGEFSPDAVSFRRHFNHAKPWE
jgi:hypothetical protein